MQVNDCAFSSLFFAPLFNLTLVDLLCQPFSPFCMRIPSRVSLFRLFLCHTIYPEKRSRADDGGHETLSANVQENGLLGVEGPALPSQTSPDRRGN